MIGVDISDRSIKVVEAVGDEPGVLRCVGWASLAPQLMHRGIIRDIPTVSIALKEAFAKCTPHPVRGFKVAASIPEIQSFVKVLEVPLMSEKETNEAVRWAVKKHIPFDLERVYLDWETVGVAPGGSDQRLVLVGASPRDVVDPLLAVLDTLDRTTVKLELEAQSVVRCLLPKDPKQAKDIRGVLVVDLGATSTNLVLFDQGAMRFTTSIGVGGDDLTRHLASVLHMSAQEALEKKEIVGLDENKANDPIVLALREATYGLVKRIEAAAREMTVQLPPEQRVRVILLSGGSANLTGIAGIFSELFPAIPVQLGNPWTNLNQGKGTKRFNLTGGDALHFTTALGLALTSEDDL